MILICLIKATATTMTAATEAIVMNPSAIASVWFAAMLACVITITLTMRQREKLEF